MIYKDVLELLSMYTTAAQIAKSKNKSEFRLNIQEAVLSELLKKAFPYMQDDINRRNIAKNILNEQSY